MFATATTASLKKTNDVVIMLKNHERALHVNAGGKVTATDISSARKYKKSIFIYRYIYVCVLMKVCVRECRASFTSAL